MIIIPKRWVSVGDFWNDEHLRPLVFLMGPIRGGDDWQADMYRILRSHPSFIEAVVAIPSRWDARHPLAAHFLEGPENIFARQLAWERHFLELAGTGRGPGCIICWLPLESAHAPHPGPEPYAMDTRGELGEWRMRMKYEQARMVVGGNPKFLGLSQIERNFSAVLGRPFPIHPTMTATVAAAALQLQQSKP